MSLYQDRRHGITMKGESTLRSMELVMHTIDLVYRFDPNNPRLKPAPTDAETARKILESGNRVFAKWMESCRKFTDHQHDHQYVVHINALPAAMQPTPGQAPKQAPFAIVVGCSDAR